MPDGDKVHAHLAPIYQKVYKQLCEGQYRSEELAIEALRSIKKNIQNYGDGPLNLIEQVAAQLKQIPTEPLLREIIDWSEESTKIDKLAQKVSGPKRAIDLVVKPCKEQLLQLYKCYILEWDSIQHIIGQGLLEEDLLQAAV